MEANDLRQMCIDSCEQIRQYMKLVNNGSESENSVNGFEILPDGYVSLRLSSGVMDPQNIKLRIGTRTYSSDYVNFKSYDSLYKKAVIKPHGSIIKHLLSLNNPNIKSKFRRISLVSDMDWLITRTQEYYEKYGHLIGYPKYSPQIGKEEYGFPNGTDPSDEQRKAVDTILNNSMSYIWGAPGTGKTQLVLATSIMALLRKGKRIAVLAPTNNAVEQVLRGVLNVLERDDPNGTLVNRNTEILRLGIPTGEFAEKYGEICEFRGISKKIKELENQCEILENVLFERRCEVLKDDFDEIKEIISRYGQNCDTKIRMAEIKPYLDDVRDVLQSSDMFRGLEINIDEYNVERRIKDLSDKIFNRERPGITLSDYDDWSFVDLENKIEEHMNEIAELESKATNARADTAKIIAMTPHTLMGRFAPPGSESEKAPILKVDHIFIDEVGYSNVIQMLPVFAFGVPVTMLGDHKQLPPVCEADPLDIEKALKAAVSYDTGNVAYDYRYLFMWSQPATHAEAYLSMDEEDIMDTYFDLDNPYMDVMKMEKLTRSHRFGANLGKILDECIYHNGIKGIANDPLKITCINAVCRNKNNRGNRTEAEAVVDYIKRNNLQDEDFVVLTPYKDHMKLIKELCENEDLDVEDNILNVHKSQGREWDTVILSVSDNDIVIPSSSGKQYVFTSTVSEEEGGGASVINTAVSRAKKELVLVCDKKFWTNRDGEMIGRMADEADTVIDFRTIP